jgi:hypothetical protein
MSEIKKWQLYKCKFRIDQVAAGKLHGKSRIFNPNILLQNFP